MKDKHDYRDVLAAHEAGHAMVAYHFGLKITSFGYDPMPHCAINQRGATKEQIGILLCAGAAATIMDYGKPMGHSFDYQIAERLGDKHLFTWKALRILNDNIPKYALFKSLMNNEHDEEALLPHEDGYSEILSIVTAAKPGWFTKLMLKRMARVQMKNPHLMARIADFQQKTIGSVYRAYDRLTGGVK